MVDLRSPYLVELVERPDGVNYDSGRWLRPDLIHREQQAPFFCRHFANLRPQRFAEFRVVV